VKCGELQCVTVTCGDSGLSEFPCDIPVLKCVAVSCSMLLCVAVCCSVLQCVAVCGSLLQCHEEKIRSFPREIQ